MMNEHPDILTLLAEFRERLAAARHHLRRAAMQNELVTGAEQALVGLVFVAAGYLLVGLAAAVAHEPRPLGWGVFIVIVLLAVAIPMIAAILRGRRCIPSLNEAAERLDLATADHNRIAIALALVEEETADTFAQAAIADGRTYLTRLCATAPEVDTSRLSGRRSALLLVLFLACTLGAGLTRFLPGIPRLGENGRDTAMLADGMARTVAQKAEDGFPPPPKTAGKNPTPTLSAEPQSDPTPARQRPAPARTEAMQGESLSGGTGQAQTAEQQAQAAGAMSSTAGGAHARPRENKPTTGKQPPHRKTREAPQNGKPQASSAVSGGSAGGGAMSPVQHDWAQREQAVEHDRDDEETDAETEDERESSTQRGGVQPSLKDRQEAPSRELGISGEQGPPGTGRGGPTPPKKSRGVASLVLGVPVPDFVKGRVGPGATKVTHERVHPTAREAAPTEGVAVPERVEPESISHQAHWPPALLPVVRAYMIALHASDPSATTPPSDKE